jgi:hypothetical protein
MMQLIDVAAQKKDCCGTGCPAKNLTVRTFILKQVGKLTAPYCNAQF